MVATTGEHEHNFTTVNTAGATTCECGASVRIDSSVIARTRRVACWIDDNLFFVNNHSKAPK